MPRLDGQLRVTVGQLSGRRFRVPPGDVRPTSDRVRESVFGRLNDLEGKVILDLYAGSGALGIEALSRGASSAVLVENAAPSTSVLKSNLVSLGLDNIARVVPGDVPRVLKRLGRGHERFDLVFLDPPYASDESVRALNALVDAELLPSDAMVVLECDRRHPPPVVEGLSVLDERRYGETAVVRYVINAS